MISKSFKCVRRDMRMWNEDSKINIFFIFGKEAILYNCHNWENVYFGKLTHINLYKEKLPILSWIENKKHKIIIVTKPFQHFLERRLFYFS